MKRQSEGRNWSLLDILKFCVNTMKPLGAWFDCSRDHHLLQFRDRKSLSNSNSKLIVRNVTFDYLAILWHFFSNLWHACSNSPLVLTRSVLLIRTLRLSCDWKHSRISLNAFECLLKSSNFFEYFQMPSETFNCQWLHETLSFVYFLSKAPIALRSGSECGSGLFLEAN